MPSVLKEEEPMIESTTPTAYPSILYLPSSSKPYSIPSAHPSLNHQTLQPTSSTSMVPNSFEQTLRPSESISGHPSLRPSTGQSNDLLSSESPTDQPRAPSTQPRAPSTQPTFSSLLPSSYPSVSQGPSLVIIANGTTNQTSIDSGAVLVDFLVEVTTAEPMNTTTMSVFEEVVKRFIMDQDANITITSVTVMMQKVGSTNRRLNGKNNSSKLEISVSIRGRLLTLNSNDSFAERVTSLSKNVLQLQQMLQEALPFFFASPSISPATPLSLPTPSPTDKIPKPALVENPIKEEGVVKDGNILQIGLICGASFLIIVGLFVGFATKRNNRRLGAQNGTIQSGRYDTGTSNSCSRRNQAQNCNRSNNIPTPTIASNDAVVNGAPPENDAHSLEWSYSTDNYSALDFEQYCFSSDLSSTSGTEFKDANESIRKDTNKILRDLESLENRSRSGNIQRTDPSSMNTLQSGMELFSVSYESDDSSKSTNGAVKTSPRYHLRRTSQFPTQYKRAQDFQTGDMIANTFSNVSSLSDTTGYFSSELGVQNLGYEMKNEVLLQIDVPASTKTGVVLKSSPYGLKVERIKQGSPFEKGDKIVAVDEKDMRNMDAQEFSNWWHKNKKREGSTFKILRKHHSAHDYFDNEI